ncbi:hypothetical protein [Halioxenophilus aromaticivorans]|uniref:Uncharacterized protein n=1 Tax=Halioxenophilus aromaticivorans TaxID=1306992 RepID=A0AAV3UAF2_9ALTE
MNLSMSTKNQPLLLLAITNVLAVAMPHALNAAEPTSLAGKASAGFVVSDFKYALSENFDEMLSCPQGVSKNEFEIYAMTPEGARKPTESEDDFEKRAMQAAYAKMANGGRNLCLHPELGEKDPYFRVLDNTRELTQGINLDGRASADDFSTPDGEQGIDNQFLRLVGCSQSFQPSGTSNGFAIEMLAGSWGILLSLSGVDDWQNDDLVEVSIFANADPIQLSPARKPLHYASYNYDSDSRFQTVTKGKIKDGVLTTEPADMRFHHVTNALMLERIFVDAQIKASISDDGALSGYLAGYMPIEALYDYQFGYRHATLADGSLAPEARRVQTSNGASFVLGYTCQGVYQAMHHLADGHYDPIEKQFTSISTQMKFEAVPAFVIETDSRNTDITSTGAQ